MHTDLDPINEMNSSSLEERKIGVEFEPLHCNEWLDQINLFHRMIYDIQSF